MINRFFDGKGARAVVQYGKICQGDRVRAWIFKRQGVYRVFQISRGLLSHGVSQALSHDAYEPKIGHPDIDMEIHLSLDFAILHIFARKIFINAQNRQENQKNLFKMSKNIQKTLAFCF